ncbi:unnamed protein product [Xylocopa violacea]|uniref:Uncharacterized protein n=1 Tax=Xylocopa violacea TaxID=135666 RepID=A0ABP1N2A0_XYLVO
MASVDEHVAADNLENDTSIISRVENLRRVLRELRDALRDERLNLHQEIEMTILQKFIELQRNYQTLTDHTRCNLCSENVACARIPGNHLKLHRTVHPNGDTPKMNYLACLGSSMYQRTVDELQDELNSFERRLSAPTTSSSSSYKRKIYDLEAICRADLNRVRSRFVRSLQSFENTIDTAEELSSRRIEPPGHRSATKEPPTESNADAFQYKRATFRDARYDRSLPRSKSLIAKRNCGLWMTYMCAKRYSDSEVYSRAYRSLKYVENPQIISTSDSDYNLKLNTSITTIFPSSLQVSCIPF